MWIRSTVLILFLFIGGWALTPLASAGQAILSWDPPATNADGSPLTDLSGYRIYYGTSPGVYGITIDVGNVITAIVPNLAGGSLYYFVVTAYDLLGNESQFSNEVNKIILGITTASLSDGTVSLAYSQTLAASGGKSPLSWSITSGSLPVGLSLNGSNGTISGTPTIAATNNFTVQVTDANGATATKALSITIYTALSLTTTSLNNGTARAAYSQTVTAAGGKTPYSWSVTTGSLPPGVVLNTSTGVISGTPTTPGTFNFTVQVQDVNGAAATKTLSITVNQAVSVTTPSLPETTAGAVYSATLQAEGGATPYTWTSTSGLPPGLSLISSTGEILGIASTAGNWSFTVTVRDVYGASAAKTLAIMVHPTPAIAATSVGNLYQGSPGPGVTFTATGGISPYTWGTTSGGLPEGLTLNTQTGAVSGTPTKPGIYSFTIRVTDALGIASSTAYQWVILATPPGNVDFATPGSVNRVEGMT
ncbi:MAG: putative Ig domain-containing protein [Nitrospirae bacterium]|nr:putative Ig domain-containing protein [Nitrospirota bacterium]